MKLYHFNTTTRMYDLFGPRHLTGTGLQQREGLFVGFLNGSPMGRSVSRKLNIVEKLIDLVFTGKWKTYDRVVKVYSLFQFFPHEYREEEFQDHGW